MMKVSVIVAEENFLSMKKRHWYIYLIIMSWY